MELIHAPVADSQSAFIAQIDAHRGYLLRAARMKLRDSSDADDVVQDTIIAAWNGRAGFRGQSALRTWLVGILNHKVVDLIRERTRRPVLSLEVIGECADQNDGDGAPELGQRTSEGPAAIYERRRLCAEVLDELEAFSPKAAQIFVMREIDGEETGAICKKLKLSSANCYVLLHRARQFLNQRFQPFAVA